MVAGSAPPGALGGTTSTSVKRARSRRRGPPPASRASLAPTMPAAPMMSACIASPSRLRVWLARAARRNQPRGRGLSPDTLPAVEEEGSWLHGPSPRSTMTRRPPRRRWSGCAPSAFPSSRWRCTGPSDGDIVPGNAPLGRPFRAGRPARRRGGRGWDGGRGTVVMALHVPEELVAEAASILHEKAIEVDKRPRPRLTASISV